MDGVRDETDQGVIDAEVAVTVASLAWRERRTRQQPELHATAEDYISTADAVLPRLRLYLDSPSRRVPT